MVQRCDDEDLGRRFSRVEQVRLERRRREKIVPNSVVSADRLTGSDRCKRVLFEPDSNLQGWIEGELGKIAENQKQLWNFDFQMGCPANIPGHHWQWHPVSAVKRSSDSNKQAAPRGSAGNVARPSKVAKTSVSSGPPTKQLKITDYLVARKYPNLIMKRADKSKLPEMNGSSSEDEGENTPAVMTQ